jgi:YVTN family beta-propeller protein
VAFTPDGATAYVTNYDAATITPIDVATGTPGAPISVGGAPFGVAVTPGGSTVYVVNSDDSDVRPLLVRVTLNQVVAEVFPGAVPA